MPRGEVQGVKNAPMGVQSKGQWLSLNYLWPCMIHVSAPFSRQAQQTPASPSGLSLKLWEAFPDLPHTQRLPCTHNSVGPCGGTLQHISRARLHVSLSREAGIIFMHRSTFSTAFLSVC